MSNQKELQALREALPNGVALTYGFRAEPRLRRQLCRIFLLGLIFAPFLRGPRAYAVGLTADAVVILPLPRRQGDVGVTAIRGADLRGLTVKQGVMRTKITIDTPTAQFRLRVPGVVARGEAREALMAVARLREMALEVS